MRQVTAKGIVLVGLGVPVAYLAWRAITVTRGAEDFLGDFLERRSQDNNIASGIANTATEIATMDRNQTLGGAIFDLLNVYDEQSGRYLGPADRIALALLGRDYLNSKLRIEAATRRAGE